MANIYLGLPLFRHQITAATSSSLMRLISRLHARNIQATWRALSQNGIDIARNLMAAEFLGDKQRAHLLFIDDDMEFEPDLIERLIAAQKPVIGAVCTTRAINLETFFIEAKKSTYRRALAKASTFCLEHPIELKGDGLCTLGAIGMGVTLIAREASISHSAGAEIGPELENSLARLPRRIKSLTRRKARL